MKKPNIRGGQAPSVLKNQTTPRLATKPKSTGKGRRPNLSPLRTALCRADRELLSAMKKLADAEKQFGEGADFISIEKSALDKIIGLFEEVRWKCEEDLDRPLAAEIIGFATVAEHELCRFVTERSLLWQGIVNALETAEFDNEQGS
jgi:hypothetical protein